MGTHLGGRHVHSITMVRHGRTSYNAAGRLQGQIDIPLDSVGEWQVEQTAEALNSLYVEGNGSRRKQIVIASDLGRAMATAHAFADPLGLTVHPDSRVRERAFGAWEGLSLDEMREQWPEDYRLWLEFKGGELHHGAESKEHVGLRGVEALNEWSSQGDDDTDLFVFSHGAWISQTLQTLLGMNKVYDDFANLISMRNAHWTRLIPLKGIEDSDRWRMVDYNQGPAVAQTSKWENPQTSGR
ncbi:histidine phosphatase family protein [Bifidobacterium crudilactis]|jgi:2,3-bisphosphoglycerate-dependent phosphoglycerate mutase|uniref:histidine phosphatase family protein n=1 Tax=Bifidobacterium crudilactis TaxID=327277 RepID=UPI002356DA54|nr:histidine phosphatase family protein [Bifidobacterium crudilactis]MCI2148595.1 histidine phosphatase family protein [Bifidobacterium crudilactis]MCI2158385.1 histidine phosphatase family protein [Bifidobacterium crudilactis]